MTRGWSFVRGAAQVIANERGQGRYCSREVQSGAVVGQRTSLDARAHCRLEATQASSLSVPAIQDRPPPPSIGACAGCRWLLGPTSSSCIDDQGDGRATTLPLLLSSAMRAPSRCPFMHAQLHHPPCATGLRTKSSPGPTHAMQHSAGPPASQHARVAGKGRGQGGSLTVQYS